MYGLDVLLQKVVLMAILILLGFIMRKAKKADGTLTKGLGDIVVYLSQPAMIIYSFLSAEFSRRILLTSLCVFVFSMLFHAAYFALASLLYKNAPEKQRTVLRFATVFTNAGFMGIPLISELLGTEAAVYATFYVVAFNIYNWSLGCYIFTKDKKYISAKKMLINPATIPTYIGLSLYIIAGLATVPTALQPLFDGFIVPVLKDDVLYLMNCTVMPLSMMMIGIRLAESDFSAMFKDKYLPFFLAIRLILIPLCVMSIMTLILMTGIVSSNILTPAAMVLCISASTPAAAMANILAERFDGDAVYASKLVSVSTLISMLTMPLIAALLKLVI